MNMYRSQLKDIADLQVWVFGVENMRNTYLKDVRKQWEDSKVLFGRTKVMAKALGTKQEDEYQVNLHKLSKVSFIDGVTDIAITWRCGIAVNITSSEGS